MDAETYGRRLVAGHTHCAATRTARAAPAIAPSDKGSSNPKLTSPPRIEQFLGGAWRADLRRIDDFRQRQPGDGVPVSRKTSAWIGYDDRNFYAVFVCDAPPGQTRARLAKREDIFSDDLPFSVPSRAELGFRIVPRHPDQQREFLLALYHREDLRLHPATRQDDRPGEHLAGPKSAADSVCRLQQFALPRPARLRGAGVPRRRAWISPLRACMCAKS